MISIVTGTLGLIVAITIFVLVRKDKLHVNHALTWIIVAVLCALMGFAPGGVDFIAARLGITYPPALALTVGIGLLTVKVLTMDIERSRSDVRIQRLIQRIAILDAEIQALRNDKQSSRKTHDANQEEKL